jgi:hypothetical protein
MLADVICPTHVRLDRSSAGFASPRKANHICRGKFAEDQVENGPVLCQEQDESRAIDVRSPHVEVEFAARNLYCDVFFVFFLSDGVTCLRHISYTDKEVHLTRKNKALVMVLSTDAPEISEDEDFRKSPRKAIHALNAFFDLIEHSNSATFESSQSNASLVDYLGNLIALKHNSHGVLHSNSSSKAS